MHRATRGNVETELAMPHDGAGCGCGYPDWVDGETVERSNRILERLRATATRTPLDAIAALPMHLVAQVGNARVAIVHGDADTLSGWAFSQEALSTSEGLREAEKAAVETHAEIIASSHTCLPVLQRFSDGRVLANNGAAGMPNFRGELYGIATRIALQPAKKSLYGIRCGDVFVDAVALRYDVAAWQKRFLDQWPAGSDAYVSYWSRLRQGPGYSRQAALRGEKLLPADQI